MSTELGEYAVGAYLREVEKCEIVDYNARSTGGGLGGLNEFDVIGLCFAKRTVFLCEVTTHLRGMNKKAVAVIEKKAKAQRLFGKVAHLKFFKTKLFMFWSPKVGPKDVPKLKALKNVELVINAEFTARMDKLRHTAKAKANPTGNPFFRSLQLLEHLHRPKDPAK